ncbi:P-loop containing nucleoside triphosphate hydrolase protein [Coniophora puteana RWD-64-598 SS2]|uniref:P-loop containing nucleoside triphosphate hydrolase protein n=1 Tax=Coniophora puteana (strain RWD-64-598) TaxID=741705 RepID=A0A5M3N5C5_CONPW|nr:P-loop containing nucleoside triphosphate hydrolase protein [Coniophora puteana RWD-64-598 SS2]EIW86264.1 P-loop containing nucleoside triphosphate hydrolase protein [Coniophora puteana RWD-64-598 SS2]
MRGQRSHNLNRKGEFNPEDAERVKHTRIGVWDLYEERHPELKYVPGSSRIETYMQMLDSMPFIWRMIKDILSIRQCTVMLILYLIVEVIASLIPAVSLWYSGQLLNLVETAVEQRTVDIDTLIHVAGGRVACTIASRLLSYGRSRLGLPLNSRIRQHYSTHIFHSMARLDVPTFSDSAVQRQLESAWSTSYRSSVAWETIQMTSAVMTTSLRLISQMSVLVAVLRDQRDGPLLAIMSFSQSLFSWYTMRKGGWKSGAVWAATTKNDDYVRMQGMKHLVDDPHHRNELVAGNLGEYLTSEYGKLSAKLGFEAGDFHEVRREHAVRDRLTLMSVLREPMKELPQIVFTLRAVQYPASIPISLASLTLINQTAQSFSSSLFHLFGETFSLAEQFASVRKLYEIEKLQNKILDGTEPFPENQQSLKSGISVEFKNVSFQYPGTDGYALRNVSFKIEAGQLCVIVGVNGSGKSTILKLISRIHDPTEGEILIDGRDIKTLKLADLRQAMAILFQDYTHFPLTIRENIALGNPSLAHDSDKIEEAARLGGASGFIEKLPDGYDTYLDRPVRDYYASLPEGTKTLFGRAVDFSRVRGAGGMRAQETTTLSGGQMQRLAVSRTFMRSLTAEGEPAVGLLLFDEPSASLDPTAEHDLFERLRALRGNKTMVFSSHRFGNLTRHADLILYMDDAEVQEEGTHDSLVAKGGEYARIWKLQAQAFV